MLTVWKYQFEIQDEVTIAMPYGSEVLSIQEQHGKPCMWVLVDPDGTIRDRTFRILGTGHASREHPGRHVGTLLVRNGALVWHIFEI